MTGTLLLLLLFNFTQPGWNFRESPRIGLESAFSQLRIHRIIRFLALSNAAPPAERPTRRKSRGSSDGSQPAVSLCFIGSLSDTPVLGPLRCKSWGGNDATTDMSLWSEEVSQTVIRLVLSFRVAHMPSNKRGKCSSVSLSECAIQR